MQRLTKMSQGLVHNTHSHLADTMRAFENQAGQITVQERLVKDARDEVTRMSDEIIQIFADCRYFVLEARTESEATKTSSEATKAAMDAQDQGLHDRQLEIATRVGQVTDWLANTETVGVAEHVAKFELNFQGLEASYQKDA